MIDTTKKTYNRNPLGVDPRQVVAELSAAGIPYVVSADRTSLEIKDYLAGVNVTLGRWEAKTKIFPNIAAAPLGYAELDRIILEHYDSNHSLAYYVGLIGLATLIMAVCPLVPIGA